MIGVERVETLVIGGGQAGLAMSYHLRQLGREHLVIERARVAERWRSERWDTLRFQFPNWMVGLPGSSYGGSDPDGFMHRDDVARFIDEYAQRISAPVRCGVNATSLRNSEDARRLIVEAGDSRFEAASVVIATGPYQQPAVPSFAAALPQSVHQVPASRYRNAEGLPPGGVCVVGSGASGCQIAEDLAQQGRKVYLSVGRHRRVPRRYRGRDYGWWQIQMGALERLSETLPADRLPALLTGVGGGHEVDLRALARQGVTLVGGLRGIDGEEMFFAKDLAENIAKGDDGVVAFRREVDEFVAAQGLDAPGEPPVRPRPALPPAPERIDLEQAGIGSVIWATGYRYAFDWIHCGVLDENGKPVHRRGVTSVPGVYFLGLPLLYKLKSAFLWGVGEDACYLAQLIASRDAH